MKKLAILTLFLATSSVAFANGSTYKITPYSSKRANVTTSQRLAIFTPGSLRLNIKRIARRYGWKQVIWKAPDDYNWVSYTKVRHNHLTGVLAEVLADYPLQAVFYLGNHVLLIQPRTLR